MPTVKVGEVELHYLERGSGPALVFLHGLGSHAEDWEPQLAHFSSSWRCIAFDLPGSGRSVDHAHPKGPFSVAGFAAAIANGIRALSLEPVHLVGLSMGAMTALQLALDAPELLRTVTMVNATASMEPRTSRERVLLGVRKLLTLTLGPKAVAKMVAPRLFPQPEHAPLREKFIAQLAALDPETYAAQSRALLGWTVEPRLSELKVPLTLICAEHDYTPVSRKQEVATRVPGAEVVVVPRTHHALPLEAPEPFNAALVARLARGWYGAQMTFALISLLVLGTDPLKGYETRRLSSLGTVGFKIEGTIQLPPKVKSTTSRESAPVGEQTPETLATVELPDGVKLLLMERNSAIAKKTDKLEAYLSKQGPLVINDHHPTGYFLAVQRKDGVVMMGANWAVEPGLDCATEKPVTVAQAKVIEAICASFKPAK